MELGNSDHYLLHFKLTISHTGQRPPTRKVNRVTQPLFKCSVSRKRGHLSLLANKCLYHRSKYLVIYLLIKNREKTDRPDFLPYSEQHKVTPFSLEDYEASLSPFSKLTSEQRGKNKTQKMTEFQNHCKTI